jgi:uncharacterized protein (TIGR03066 family)
MRRVRSLAVLVGFIGALGAAPVPKFIRTQEQLLVGHWSHTESEDKATEDASPLGYLTKIEFTDKGKILLLFSTIPPGKLGSGKIFLIEGTYKLDGDKIETTYSGKMGSLTIIKLTDVALVVLDKNQKKIWFARSAAPTASTKIQIQKPTATP